MNRICTIIPAYNVEETISTVILGASQFIKKRDIIVIDDGSADNTFQNAQKAGAVVLKNFHNSGKGFSLKKGYQWAIDNSYQATICLDGDLQHDPTDIPAFLECFKKTDADLILGSRIADLSTMPWDRRFSNKASSLIISLLTNQRVRDSQCGYRLIKTEILKKIKLKSNNYETESELLVKALKRKVAFCHVPIKTIYNSQPSHINRLVDSLRFVRMVIVSLIKCC